MFNSKLTKWFLAWVVMMLVVIIIFQPDTRPEKIDFVSFDTNEADELYFKNVRLFYYSTSEEGEGIFDVHRLSSLKSSDEALLPFAIYHSWRANEAFIRLDTTFTNKFSGGVLIKDSAGVSVTISSLPAPNNEAQYEFARIVYKALKENSRLGLRYREKDFWFKESSSRSIRQCLNDYFKLVGKL